MKQLLFILIFMCVGSSLIHAQSNPVTTTVPFLSETPEARDGGMGDVGVATAPDVYSQYCNPAKYAFIQHNTGLSLSYNSLYRRVVSGISLGYLTAYYRLDANSVLSGSLRDFSLGQISISDEYGYFVADAYPMDFAFDLAYSRKLTENFSIAAALRYIYSNLNIATNLSGETEMYAGNSLAFDIAGYFHHPLSFISGTGDVAFGLNISNVGSKMSYDEYQTSYFIPTNMRLGTSFDYPFNEKVRLKLSADAGKLLVPTPNGITDLNSVSEMEGIFRSFSDAPGGLKEELQEIKWSVGSEVSLYNIGFLRGGYSYENVHKGSHRYATLGAGIKLFNIQLDAAYLIATSHSIPYDRTLRFSLAYEF